MLRVLGLFSVLLIFSILFAIPAFQPDKANRKRDPRVLLPGDIDHEVDYSNILPSDYVGPDVCAECHEEYYEKWQSHPHSKMNRNANGESIRGDFDNAVLNLPTGHVTFVKRDGKFLMEVFRDDQRRRLYEVTRTVGSRYMQAYIGRQLKGPEPADHDIYKEHRLPFGYWFKLNRWVPRVFMNAYGDEKLVHGIPVDEAIDGDPRIDLYGANCMNCHNTFPYAYRIFHDFMVGFPDATVAAEVHQLSHSVADQVKVDPSVKGFIRLNEQLDPDRDLVSMGVSCESCHFGGREHAIREREIRFLPTSKLTRISADQPHHIPSGSRDDALTTRGICTQCHSGAADLFPNGAGKGNSREGMDLFAGACASELSCIDCHDPHSGTSSENTGVDLNRQLNSCIKCHDEYQNEAYARSHSGPGHAAVNCLDCHMPRFTRGVDHLIRTHRVSLPIEESMVANGMANACNACHLDKSVRWALDKQEQIWNRKLEPASDWKSFEQLDQPAWQVWVHSQDSHMRFLVTQWIARSKWGSKWFQWVARSLNDPEPVNRVFATFAVTDLLGIEPDTAIPVDITAGPQVRQQQIRELVHEFERRMKQGTK